MEFRNSRTASTRLSPPTVATAAFLIIACSWSVGLSSAPAAEPTTAIGDGSEQRLVEMVMVARGEKG
jgi:hypothetical protein